MLGGALVLPALIALLPSYVLPTLRTARSGLRDETPLEDSAEFVGLDNYRSLLESDQSLGLGFVLSLTVLPLVLLTLVAPLIAWSASIAGRPTRWAVRLLLSVPLVASVPAVLGIAWFRDDRERPWLDSPPARFGDAAAAPGNLRMIIWLTVFGLVCALGVTVYLAVFRGQRPGRSVWPPLLTTILAAALATVAVALQTITLPQVLTGGGPGEATITPLLFSHLLGFRNFELGIAAAAATLVLVPVMMLGLLTALLLIGTQLRIGFGDREPARPGRSGRRTLAILGAVFGAGLVLLVAFDGIWPWLVRSGISTESEPPVARILAHTWLPPLISTVVGIGLAALAAFGIGALRPLGRYSELLLLPFAPWLFVGFGTLAPDAMAQVIGDSGPGPEIIKLIPSQLLSIPALFLFTLLFRGLAQGWRPGSGIPPAVPGMPPSGHGMPPAGPGVPQLGSGMTAPGPVTAPSGPGRTPAQPTLGSIIVRALPMVALVGVATWILTAMSFTRAWTATPPNRDHAILWSADVLAQYGDDIGLGLAYPLPLAAFLLLGVGALQLFYLDRLAIRVGNDAT